MEADEYIERWVPDLVSTENLPVAAAAEVDFLAGRLSRWSSGDAGISPAVRARALAASGDDAQARQVLSGVVVEQLSLADLVAMAWTVARVGPADRVTEVMDALTLHDEFLLDGSLPLGPRNTIVGELLAASGQLEQAAEMLDVAVKVGDQRAPIWGALARIGQARIYLCIAAIPQIPRDESDQLDRRINQLLTSARTLFRAGGYQSLLQRSDALTGSSPEASAAGAPCTGHFAPGHRWTVGFGVMPITQVRAGKGLVGIHYLLSNAGRLVPAVEIDRVVNGGDVVEITDLATPYRIDSLETTSTDLTGRLRSVLLDETTRNSVGKLIHRTIGRLEAAHPLLGRHLRESVRTGHVCQYKPTGSPTVTWRW